MSNEVAHTVQEVAETVAATAVPAQKAVNTATRLFYKSAGKVRRFSPQILMVAGIAGVTTGAVLAARATLRLGNVVETANDKIEDVKELRSDKGFETEVDYNKALTKAYFNRAFQVTKLYTPALSVGMVGIGCLLGSHGIMSQRNVAMAAAVKAVESSFAQYRERVVDEFGEDVDRDLRFGIVEKEIPTFDEDGKQTGTQKQMEITHGKFSDYARCFEATNDNWSNIPGANQMFLTQQQNWLNDRLRARGYLFLNDVYKALGFPATPAGQVIGWLAPNNEDSKDGFVDFGLMDIENQGKIDFVNGFERSCWLDFNVDGVVYDKL